MRFDCPHCSQPIEVVPDLAADSVDVICPSCGSQFPISLNDETATLPIAAPPKLEHFELREAIGSGQFGRVWKAIDRDLKRVVAVKIPHKRRLSREEARYFLREARAAAKLEHPHIVSVYEVGQVEQTLYIASEFIDGPSMRQWLSREKRSPQAVAEVCRQTADALACAHEHGIVHRDLKPGNIILDANEKAHITDFGLAKQQHQEATIALDGRVLGTLAYMSPEQLRDSHRVDGRTDIYSLGVILYEALTGERPFHGGREIIAQRILHATPTKPREIDPSIPAPLETICLKCMEKSPERRYPSAQALAADLQAYLNGEDISAQPPPRWVEGLRWLGRRPSIATAIGLALVAVLLAAVAALRPPRQPPVGEAAIMIHLQTIPPKANVVFVPRDPFDGHLRTDALIRAGKSPIRQQLLPGDYLVVAYTDDQRQFHEVYRRVPDAPSIQSGNTGLYPHLKWTPSDDSDRTVELPPVRLFDQSRVVADMVRVRGGTWDLPTSIPTSHRQPTVPDFYLDASEVTYDQLSTDQLAVIPSTSSGSDPGVPVTNIDWDTAAALAEMLGKRLATRYEYEWVTTLGGQRYDAEHWPRIDAKVPGVIKGGPWDRIEFDGASGPLIGLRSNVMEWTDSAPQIPSSSSTLRNISGGLTLRAPGDNAHVARPPVPAALPKTARNERLGFRCARSIRPRITAKDFERSAVVRTPKAKDAE